MRNRAFFWILTVIAAILLASPIRTGDLTGYDDALYAHIAKAIVVTGDWVHLQSNGIAALEHPPLFPWIEAALFLRFGFSDTVARVPAAVCGLGIILLVYWLTRRLLKDSFAALLAMFVMTTSIYFLKYAARAMTDVPFTFFFLCAICAWILAEDKPGWYVAAGLFTACAQMTRGVMGIALPIIFAIHLIWSKRRASPGYLATGLIIAFLPITVWYVHLMSTYGTWFLSMHSGWLERQVYGGLTPAWRRYTGLPEYLWMVVKSYWPWLPFMVTGIVVVIRSRDRRLALLVVWAAVVYVLCGAARARVLRYMLPAYPAFAVLATIGLLKLIPQRFLQNGVKILTPVLATIALALAIFPRTTSQAATILPIARAADSATAEGEYVAFYDEGQPRYDESNQLLWYGNRLLFFLQDPREILDLVMTQEARIFIVDKGAYRDYFESKVDHTIVATSGHLVCLRVN